MVEHLTISLISLGVASGIALITLYGVLSTTKITRESNKLLRTDLEARIRPLFEFERIYASLHTSGDKYEVRLSVTIKNVGIVPARKIIAHMKETNNKKINDIILEKDAIRKTSLEIGTIPNDGHSAYTHTLPWTKDKQRTNFVMWFDYIYLNNQKDSFMVVFDVTPGSHIVNYVWFSKEDIEEAEKHRNDLMQGIGGASV